MSASESAYLSRRSGKQKLKKSSESAKMSHLPVAAFMPLFRALPVMPLFAEDELNVGTVVPCEVVEIDNGGVAVVVDDDNLHVVSQGDGREASVEEARQVVVGDDDGERWHGVMDGVG